MGLTAAVALLAAVLVTEAGGWQATHTSRAPALLTEGIAADPCAPQTVIIVPAHRNVRYGDGDSSVLVTGSGPAAGGGDAPATANGCTPAGVTASRGWLAAGSVPGMNPRTRSMAQRALLDLHLSTRPDGAVVAGWYPGWDYAWPRDSSWVAVALAVTGHGADALRVLTFLQQEQSRDGTWAGRYQPDGGGAVRDGRPAELDAVGWVPWAVWSWYETGAGHRRGSARIGGPPGLDRRCRAAGAGRAGASAAGHPGAAGRPARRRGRLPAPAAERGGPLRSGAAERGRPPTGR